MNIKMAFDGIVTKTVIHELNNIIGYKIDKVHQPDKNTVILGLYKQSSNLALLSCISANNYRLHLTTRNSEKILYQHPIFVCYLENI